MRAARLTRSRPAIAAIGERLTLDAVAALFTAYAIIVFALFLALALLVPYHFWDSLSFGGWSRLIAERGGFHLPSATAPDLQRPFFYVLQGWTWRIFGFHEPLGRLLSLAFTGLLAGSLAALARRHHRYRRVEAAIVLVLLVTSPAFLEQALSGMSDVPTAALVAATGAALWLLPVSRVRFPLLVLLAACCGLTKSTGLLGLGALFLASLVGPWATLKARALAGALPIGLGMLAALAYFQYQASQHGLTVLGLLRSGTASGFYAGLAAKGRVRAVPGLDWLGAGSTVLPLLLAFGFAYAFLRVAGARHRTAATIAAPAGILLSWLGPWLSANEQTLRVGPLASSRALVIWLLLAGPLLLARDCPEELAPSRLGLARLLLWCVPPLAVWLHETPYAPRLGAAAWPGLFLLLGASLLPAFVGTARRAPLAVAAPAAALVAGAVLCLGTIDHLDGTSWSRLAALPRSEWFDRTEVRRAISAPGFTEALEAARRVTGAEGRVFTSSGEFRFFFPGRITQDYARSCGDLTGYTTFVLLTDSVSTSVLQGSTGSTGAASAGYWAACTSPRLRAVESAGVYAVFRVLG
ncbi:MAG: Dolichyl-phosphate-mannose-protein mannosyltransferase [Gaiellaceae bacterium]|nr:Dolichyl-phosphate-mannose-protein mannosyltransferase [Gaiellaceae bacterium]